MLALKQNTSNLCGEGRSQGGREEKMQAVKEKLNDMSAKRKAKADAKAEEKVIYIYK